MKEYETIPPVTIDGQLATEDESRCHFPSYVYAKIGMLVGVVVLLSVTFIHPHSEASGRGGDDDSPPLALEGSATPTGARPCAFSECYDSSCNWDLAPYTCLRWNGGPHGGCSQAPWYESTCTEQCNLIGCADLAIPDDEESCDVPCDEAWCAVGPRLCGSVAPFQCTTGASTYGCAEDEFLWTLRSSSTACSACCNANTC